MHDDVAVANGGDRTAARRLGRDVADHEAARRAGEAAVGDQRDRLAEPGADDRRRSPPSISRMPGPPLGPFVADDDDVARLDRLPLHGGERRLLAVEDARRAAMHRRGRCPTTFTTQPSGARLPRRMTRPPRRLERLVERPHHLLARRLDGAAPLPRRACGRSPSARRRRAAPASSRRCATSATAAGARADRSRRSGPPASGRRAAACAR